MTAPADPGLRPWPTIAIFAALLICLVAVYAPAMHGEFLWDDDVYVSENRLLTEPGGLARLWFSTEAPSQYFPLTYTVLWVERRLWGLDTTGYHLVNILLHGATAILLGLLLRSLAIPGAFLAAWLFALHPVQVESVAWISELKNVLSGALGMAAALSWVRFAKERGGRGWYAATLVLSLAAMLAKSTLVVLPAALLVLSSFQGSLDRRRALRLVPVLGMSVFLGALTVWWERVHQGTAGPIFEQPVLGRLALAGRAVWFYLGKLLVPLEMSFSYPAWIIDPGDPRAWIGVAGAVLAAILLFGWRRRIGRGLPAASALYLVLLAPMLGLVAVWTHLFSWVADHYVYLAAAPALAVAAAALSAPRRHRAVGFVAGRLLPVVLLVVLAVLSSRRAAVFADPEALWRDTLRVNPVSWMARSNLGRVLAKRGRVPEAEILYRESLALEPRHPTAWKELGDIERSLGKIAEAFASYDEALQQVPLFADAWAAKGRLLASLGRMEEAEEHLQAAVHLKPRETAARVDLARLFAGTGRLGTALAVIEQGLELAPEDAFLGAVRDELAAGVR